MLENKLTYSKLKSNRDERPHRKSPLRGNHRGREGDLEVPFDVQKPPQLRPPVADHRPRRLGSRAANVCVLLSADRTAPDRLQQCPLEKTPGGGRDEYRLPLHPGERAPRSRVRQPVSE